MNNFFSHPLEGEQRQIGRDDDQRGEEHRLGHFQRGFQRAVFRELLVGIAFMAAKDDFQQHNRAVHDDAKVNRAERKQVGRDVGVVHQHERPKQ